MTERAVERLTAPNTQLAIEGSGVTPKLANTCCVCRRPLRSKKWALLGIGPVCARKNPAVLVSISPTSDMRD